MAVDLSLTGLVSPSRVVSCNPPELSPASREEGVGRRRPSAVSELRTVATRRRLSARGGVRGIDMSRRARRGRQGGPNAGTQRSVRLPLRRRRQWHNHTGNQAVDAVCVVPARSVEELVAAVGRARDEGLTIRCVGSGHSWSDVALTTGYLVSPQHLGGVERVKKELLRSGVDGEYLVSVGSGNRIHEVNAWLDRHGLALQQMGGYDGQTLAGVVSTSTHGSGMKFGPFPDYVRSVDLVDGTGTPRRIEPSGGGETEPGR